MLSHSVCPPVADPWGLALESPSTQMAQFVRYNITVQPQISKMQDFHSAAKRVNGRWTKEEHLHFLEGLRIYGKNWKKIEQAIETRTGSQIRSHAQKFFLKMHQSTAGEFDEQAYEEELLDEADEPTLISKSGLDSGCRREDVSFYLGRIMDHYEGKQCLDFWTTLVDSKPATENSNEGPKNNSFTRTGGALVSCGEAKGPISDQQ